MENNEINKLAIYNTDPSYLEAIKPRKKYKIYKANVLAQVQGNLKREEQSIFDYCLSFVKISDLYDKTKVYKTTLSELRETLEIKNTGQNKDHILMNIRNIKNKSNLLIPIQEDKNGKIIQGYNYISAFHHLKIWENGDIEFSFHEELAPYIYSLKEEGKFYSEELSRLLAMKSKYGHNLHGLWRSKQHGDAKITVIEGSVEEWQLWMLGSEIYHDPVKISQWKPGKLKDKAINVGAKHLKKYFKVSTEVVTHKKKGKTVAYTVRIIQKNSKELLAINDIISQKRKQLDFEKEHEDEYMKLIIANAISLSISPLESAINLKNDETISFIPPSLLPKDK